MKSFASIFKRNSAVMKSNMQPESIFLKYISAKRMNVNTIRYIYLSNVKKRSQV